MQDANGTLEGQPPPFSLYRVARGLIGSSQGQCLANRRMQRHIIDQYSPFFHQHVGETLSAHDRRDAPRNDYPLRGIL